MKQSEIAEKIATKAHLGQKRRGGLDYISHPCAVASACFTDYQKAAAWLHDVLEDTTLTVQDLREQGINSIVISAVIHLTKMKNEEYSHFIYRCARNPIAKFVKAKDLQHNLSDLEDGNLRQKYLLALKYLSLSEFDTDNSIFTENLGTINV